MVSFIPGYSGGSVPDFHRIPFYLQVQHLILVKLLFSLGSVKEKPRVSQAENLCDRGLGFNPV